MFYVFQIMETNIFSYLLASREPKYGQGNMLNI